MVLSKIPSKEEKVKKRYSIFLLYFGLVTFFIAHSVNIFAEEDSYKQALKYYVNGQFGKSHKVLEGLLKDNWDDYDIVLLAAYVTWKQGQRSWALANFDRAIRIAPKRIAPYIGKIELFLELKKLGDAAKIAERATVRFSEKWQAWHFLAKVALAQKKWPKAIESAEKSISLKSDNYKPYNLLGLAYLSSSRYDLAYISFKTALSFAPKSAYILNNLGVVMEKKKDFKKAREYYERCLEIEPLHPTAKLNLQRL